MEPMFTK